MNMQRTIALLMLVCLPLSALAAANAATKGNITFEPKNAAPVLFSHEHHIKTRGVKCQACHYQSFSSGGSSFQMKRDKLTKRDFCEHCHNGLKGFDAKSEKNCMRCHQK
jgi:c(7)-type cytochrome triheme protein